MIAPAGLLVHEIRLSLSEGRWEARIVTLPNQVWVEPGGGRALTFVADTAGRAQEMAARFIDEDRKARGHRLEQRVTTDSAEGDRPATRHAARYPVTFAQRGALDPAEAQRTHRAETLNLSETGLFIATEAVAPPGALLQIELEPQAPLAPLKLRGVVRWTRAQATPECGAGMGISLLNPPADYLELVASLVRVEAPA